MFKITTIYLLGGLGLLLSACGTKSDIQSNQIPATGARVKFVHAVVDGPTVNVFANDTKLNGTALAYGTSFPTEYSALMPGQTTLKVSTVASGTVAETAVLTAPVALEADKYYSVVAAGTAAAPVGFIIDDDQTVANPKKNYIRVLNLLSTGQSVDLAIASGTPATVTTPVTNLAYKGVSAYVEVDPNAAASPYSLQIRSTGTTTAIGTALSFNTLNQGRKYTLVVRGAVGRTGTAAPTLFTYTVK
ncbi:DUF4397 domain-containing protein [Fibrella forsythiae]|uniref:DUF4397 domain-containing protein n=1 Tax=Fibrella forsythiae TaxID=2817061 RepID=A0ABS3JE91_9BACT|nr:DUF4397 domain-containing protein [Fibrella forsythiae]MBO0948320.1 DUF4397 domain-containing protein [Fibrella forsythiae]